MGAERMEMTEKRRENGKKTPEEARAAKRVLGSEALGILLGRWKDGTFSEMLTDWKWILTYTRRYRLAVLAYILLGVASASLSLVSAVASKYTIDIITGYDSARLWLVILLMIASALSSLLLNSVTSRISTKVALRVNNDIQAEVFDQVLQADWCALNQFSSGDLLNRLSGDAVTVAGNAINWLPDLVIACYTFAATFLVILHYDWIMALLALASAPCLMLSSRRLLQRMRKFNQETRAASSALMAFETETFHNLDAIKAFGVTARYSSGLRRLQGKFCALSLDYNRFSIYTQAALSLLGSAVQFAAFLYCLYLLWSGKILYGTMTLFLSQCAKLSTAFHSLVRTVPTFLTASVSAHRIQELMELEQEAWVEESDTLADSAQAGFSVCMDGVCFAYQEECVLQDVGFQASPGEIVALIGPSGGGKTTMIRMILGLIHPSQGRAYLQDSTGREVEMNVALRRYFSYVPQGNTMISGTIADNLRMVREDASDEALEQALRTACAWDFVQKLPDGLYGSVGEKGHGLSEGQAQRVAIARALLRDAPVLLLDEATSALDVATERQVLRNLMQCHPNKTCIVTTHRPSVVGLCQRVYQVSDGQLRELSQEEAEQMAMEF